MKDDRYGGTVCCERTLVCTVMRRGPSKITKKLFLSRKGPYDMLCEQKGW